MQLWPTQSTRRQDGDLCQALQIYINSIKEIIHYYFGRCQRGVCKDTLLNTPGQGDNNDNV